MLNSYEDIFYSRVMRNTGMTAFEIRQNFNNGDMIFASDAKENGFVKEITTFHKLMKSLNMGSTFVPTASVSESSTSDNSNEIKTGADMEFNRENFDILLESRKHLNGNIEALNTQIKDGATALEALQADMNSVEAKATEATEKLDSFKAETTTRMQEAISTGVPLEVALSMINATTAEDSSKLAIDAKESEGHLNQTPTEQVKSSWGDHKFNRGDK
jgi:hypothetical protein